MHQELNNQKIKYFLYARKSSESEDRQILSIPAQVDELEKIAEQEGLQIVKTKTEAKSAKAPGRKGFNEMLKIIDEGKVNGILCWALDRLARNSADAGSIKYRLETGLLKFIKTPTRSFTSEDNHLITAVEFGSASDFIRVLRANTKRGLLRKCEQGDFPGLAPIGYLNNKFKEKGRKDIMKDPERFDLVRKLWDILLTGNFSIQKLYENTTEELRLTRKNGKKMGRSRFYNIFKDPFYYGAFVYAGVLYPKGNHDLMITKDEFDRAQIILGNASKPRKQTHNFAFTGMIRCGECGSMITAEDKVKRQKNGNVHFYTYYRCTKRRNPKCTQKYIGVKDLETQIARMLQNIEIPTEFHEWAMECLRTENKQEAKNRNVLLGNNKRAYENCIRKIDALIDMRAGNEITEEEFFSKKQLLLQEKARLHEILDDTDGRMNNWIQTAQTVFDFARDAKQKFETGTLEEKKAILSALGSNLTLKDQKLSISIEKPLLLIERAAKKVKMLRQRFEPLKNGSNERNWEKIYSQNPVLGG
ncbi:MAG: recombinase family protein [Candidatus Nealsonbacteria bacterium]|nr:recombinase family protein [Candidatus Nealsonbacteria bacterium]